MYSSTDHSRNWKEIELLAKTGALKEYMHSNDTNNSCRIPSIKPKTFGIYMDKKNKNNRVQEIEK